MRREPHPKPAGAVSMIHWIMSFCKDLVRRRTSTENEDFTGADDKILPSCLSFFTSKRRTTTPLIISNTLSCTVVCLPTCEPDNPTRSESRNCSHFWLRVMNSYLFMNSGKILRISSAVITNSLYSNILVMKNSFYARADQVLGIPGRDIGA